MGLFDGVVAELAQKFGLGDRAGPLTSSFLAYLTDPQRGGVSGFLDRFRQAGLGDQVASWVGRGANAPLAPEQLEQGMGGDAVKRVATSAGVSPGIAGSALAFLVPKVVDLLTPDGTVPAGLPTGLGASLSAAAGAVGTGARRTAAADGTAAAPGGSTLRRLVPLLLLLLLGFVGYRLFTRNPTQTPLAGVGSDTAKVPGAATDEPVITGTAPATAPPEAGADADNPEAAVDAAMRKASDALSGLRPGYSAEDLADALNLNIINFASGSATLPAQSRPILDQSAKAIAGAPEGTVLQIGGHTDNTGDAAANERLSARRAEAVRGYLVQHGAPAAGLETKGYGQSRPVADNGTEAGRFRNRRIEFQVVK